MKSPRLPGKSGQRGYQNRIFMEVAHAPMGRATANENG
jgi:hypothetical protein